MKCHDIKLYVQEVENVEFVDYEFKNNLSKKLLDSISKVHNEDLITTNQNLLHE